VTDSLIRTGTAPIDPALCGSLERLYSPLWISTVFAPEVTEAFDGLGIAPMARYFATRSAPMGAVPAPVVVSTFFNFSPAAVGAAIPQVWEQVTPGQLLAVQRDGVGRALARLLADVDVAVLAEARSLLGTAAEAAAQRPEGRPLFAGYASLPWPDDPLVALWHAHYLLREFRGDGHVAVLVEQGLTGLEAMLLHVALMPVLAPIFRPSRAWTDEQWDTAMERLRADDWLTADDEPTLTPTGRERRAAIERRTDELNVPAYAALGPAGCRRLNELGVPINKALTLDGAALPSLLP
jgi:hypothetical protein